MSLFSIRRTRHIVPDFPSLRRSIPLGQTHTEGLVCFWRARNPITFETTSVAPNDSPAGYLIAPTTGTDTEAASHSTVCAVETFPLWLQTVSALPHAVPSCRSNGIQSSLSKKQELENIKHQHLQSTHKASLILKFMNHHKYTTQIKGDIDKQSVSPLALHSSHNN